MVLATEWGECEQRICAALQFLNWLLITQGADRDVTGTNTFYGNCHFRLLNGTPDWRQMRKYIYWGLPVIISRLSTADKPAFLKRSTKRAQLLSPWENTEALVLSHFTIDLWSILYILNLFFFHYKKMENINSAIWCHRHLYIFPEPASVRFPLNFNWT